MTFSTKGCPKILPLFNLAVHVIPQGVQCRTGIAPPRKRIKVSCLPTQPPHFHQKHQEGYRGRDTQPLSDGWGKGLRLRYPWPGVV